MLQGARIRVRYGRTTPFWTNRWVNSWIVLEDFADRSNPGFNAAEMVCDFIVEDGVWDTNKLNELLPDELVKQVVGMSAPRSTSGEDVWVWGGEKNGCYSIRSAYSLISCSMSVEQEDLWRLIWKWQRPNKIRLFLWLSGHGKLLTNAERVRRHIAIVSTCDRCGHPSEMACHILRDCYFEEDVWTELGFNTGSLDWNEDFTRWFKRFIVGEKSLLFGVTLWYLWKSRNEFTFSNVRDLPSIIARKASAWTSSVIAAMDRDTRMGFNVGRRMVSPIAWDPGPGEWVMVNTDGSVLRNPNRAAAGGIVRTSDGHALEAFVANLGSCSVTRAELHGAVLGLELAWSKGCRLVEVQLDSRAATSLLLQTDEPLHQHALEVLAFQDCDIPIAKAIRLRISLLIMGTTFRLAFICFCFMIVISVIFFDMTVWEFRRPGTL
ncbi:Putative ribonuclease H protein At1g65750 [Linum perenne]